MARIKAVRRKYTRRKPYLPNTEGFEKYQATKRLSKTITSASKSIGKNVSEYAKYAQEYEAYQREYYRISKSLRQGKVQVTKTWFHSGDKYATNIRAEVMDYRTYRRYREKFYDLSATDIASKQYNLMREDLALDLQQKLADAGYNYTLEQIRAKQLPREVWNKMQQVAQDKDQTVSQYWFGSL